MTRDDHPCHDRLKDYHRRYHRVKTPQKKSELEEWLDFGRFDGRQTRSYGGNDRRNMAGEPVLIFCINVEESTKTRPRHSRRHEGRVIGDDRSAISQVRFK